MQQLLAEIRKCDYCKQHLPLPPRPILAGASQSKIILISQAPGKKAHEQNLAWDDASGKRLKLWLGVNNATFYDPSNFAILPMGFCYPGKAKTGDLPPRKECAPLWHQHVWDQFKNVKLTVIIGKYAQDYYLGDKSKKNLTQNIAHYKEFLPEIFTLPHPSPVNRFWFSKNKWFEETVIPDLRTRIAQILNNN